VPPIPDISFPKTDRSYTNDNRQRTLREAVRVLVDDSHGASVAAGHSDPETGVRCPVDVPQKLMLIVSEVAEAMEGHRKGLMDDKLPTRAMIEVELADAVIRIFDLAGSLGLDLPGAYVEKRAFNDVRPDHKVIARLAPGGKKY
jgi:NTP pyrophosphatase (non-canonical NTP hydrolase)